MTGYFDDVHMKINVTPDEFESARELDSIEEKLVFDCTVCAMLPEFPVDMGLRVHQVVMARGVCMLPVNAGQPEIDTVQQHKDRIHDLCGDLHTVFHDLCRMSLVNFSDDPTFPLRVLYAKGEGVREEMV